MTRLTLGEPAPWFHAPALGGNPKFAFNTVAGRHILLLFMGSGPAERIGAALDALGRRRALFDDHQASFFGVIGSTDLLSDKRVAPSIPGIRFFLDPSGEVNALFAQSDDPPFWLLLDPTLRVVSSAPIEQAQAMLDQLAALAAAPEPNMPAPVLIVPRIFEPALCKQLALYYEAQGGEDSGFMRDVDGKTHMIVDHGHKRRSDCTIRDERLLEQLRGRLARSLAPQIQRAFQFNPTRVERWIVARYDADTGGHFRPHRDNTTKGTAHRRFACTINLNTEDYEGGDLRFPEYGSRAYRAPTGGALIFSCSLLHEAMPVTAGRRYAFLPFFYDEAAAAQRESNNAFLGEGVTPYRDETGARA